MSSLNELQELFQAHLLCGDKKIAQHVSAPRGEGEARHRLAIYFDAYRLRLCETLENDFPALKALAGGDTFEKISQAYLAAHPSKTFSLRWFGAHMAKFLETAPPWKANPALCEMARFEWALGEAFDSADFSPLDEESFSCIPPQSWAVMSLVFQPGLMRLELSRQTPRCWQAIEAGESGEAGAKRAQREEGNGENGENGEKIPWLVWRSGLGLRFRSLAVDEAVMMDGARSGKNFAALCSQLCCGEGEEAEMNAAVRAASLLKSWTREGLLASIKLPA